MTSKKAYQNRDEAAAHMVSVWRDAVAFSYPQETVLAGLQRVRESKLYQDLPRYQKQYVEGFVRSFEVNVVDRMYLEYGNWVNMPDGSVRWFGLPERINSTLVYDAGIDYKWMTEKSIPERTGIFWVADAARGRAAGEKPFFVG